MKKIEKTSVLFVFFKRNIYFWVIENWQKKKTDMSGIKGVDKKNAMLKMIKKKFLRKMFVGIKDDRDSMTRQENLQKRCKLGLDRCLPFCRLSSKFHCGYFGNKA